MKWFHVVRYLLNGRFLTCYSFWQRVNPCNITFVIILQWSLTWLSWNPAKIFLWPGLNTGRLRFWTVLPDLSCKLDSITSCHSGNEPALLHRTGETRHERSAEIDPSFKPEFTRCICMLLKAVQGSKIKKI